VGLVIGVCRGDVADPNLLMMIEGSGNLEIDPAQVGAVLLAAGLASRMRGIVKQLLRIDGEPLVGRTLRVLCEAGIGQVVVVTGHQAEAIESALVNDFPDCGARMSSEVYADASRVMERNSKPTVRIKRNPDYLVGQQSSVLCGLQALPVQTDPVLVVLGDLALLQAQDIRELLSAFAQRAPGKRILVPRFRDQRGNPVVVERTIVDQVINQRDPRNGLRGFIDAHRDLVASSEVSNDHYVFDLDTPSDILVLESKLGRAVAGWDRTAFIE
jgi:molybdenum cofactor cytidylyltransferase